MSLILEEILYDEGEGPLSQGGRLLSVVCTKSYGWQGTSFSEGDVYFIYEDNIDWWTGGFWRVVDAPPLKMQKCKRK